MLGHQVVDWQPVRVVVVGPRSPSCASQLSLACVRDAPAHRHARVSWLRRTNQPRCRVRAQGQNLPEPSRHADQGAHIALGSAPRHALRGAPEECVRSNGRLRSSDELRFAVQHQRNCQALVRWA